MTTADAKRIEKIARESAALARKTLKKTNELETYLSLLHAFRASYRGNRAPLSIGFHFETWDAWAYDHALTRLLVRVCDLPDVRCASARELVDWLESRRLNRR